MNAKIRWRFVSTSAQYEFRKNGWRTQGQLIIEFDLGINAWTLANYKIRNSMKASKTANDEAQFGHEGSSGPSFTAPFSAVWKIPLRLFHVWVEMSMATLCTDCFSREPGNEPDDKCIEEHHLPSESAFRNHDFPWTVTSSLRPCRIEKNQRNYSFTERRRAPLIGPNFHVKQPNHIFFVLPSPQNFIHEIGWSDSRGWFQ